MIAVHDAVDLFDAGSIQDPYPLYERMRSAGPVHRVADSDFYVVCGWEAVNEAIGRTEDFSSNLTATMTYMPDGSVQAFTMDGLGGPTQVLATADDPLHAVHRKLLVRHLAAKRIRAIEQFTAAAADRLWHRVCVTGKSNGWEPWPTACR